MNSARQERYEVAKRVRESLARIVQYNYVERVGIIKAESDVGPLALDFVDCQRIYAFFEDRNLELLALNTLNELDAASKTMISFSQRFFEYQPGTPKSYIIKSHLQNSIENHFNDIASKLLPHVPTVSWTVADEKIRARSQDFEKQIENQIREANSLTNRIANEGAAVIEQLKIHASATAVESNATDIAKEVENFETLARRWFGATIIGALVLVLVAIYMIKLAYAPAQLTAGNAIHIAITKVVFLSTLSIVVVWCSRNYRACMHNIVANRQRISALRTYRLLAEGAPDVAIRGSIVLQAANATFAMRGTGFEDDKADAGIGNPALGVDGLIRAASGARGT